MNNFMDLVTNFYNDYHAKVSSYPTLYVSSPTILTVILPSSLKQFCNAAAGRASDAAGAAPNGIRITASDARVARDNIFESVDSLAQFILSSERNWAIVPGARLGATVATNDKLVKNSLSFITKSYGNKIFMELAKKFGRDVVINDREVLTINEFELRYGLSK